MIRKVNIGWMPPALQFLFTMRGESFRDTEKSLVANLEVETKNKTPVSDLIHAVDHSRVILKEMDPNITGSDYVNANFVGVSSPNTAVFKIIHRGYYTVARRYEFYF